MTENQTDRVLMFCWPHSGRTQKRSINNAVTRSLTSYQYHFRYSKSYDQNTGALSNNTQTQQTNTHERYTEFPSLPYLACLCYFSSLSIAIRATRMPGNLTFHCVGGVFSRFYLFRRRYRVYKWQEKWALLREVSRVPGYYQFYIGFLHRISFPFLSFVHVWTSFFYPLFGLFLHISSFFLFRERELIKATCIIL